MNSKVISVIYLRFHARIILAIVAFSGFIGSHLLLKYFSIGILFRYPVAALISYCVFLISMHYWKHFLEDLHPVKTSDKPISIVDQKTESPFKWTDYLNELTNNLDLDDFFISVIVLVVLVVLFYSVGLIVFEIPILLIELVLSGLTTTVFFKSIKKADSNIFIFKVFKQTAWVGLLLVLIYFVVGCVVVSTCPTALRFTDLFTDACTWSQ